MTITLQEAERYLEFVLGDDGEGGLHRAQSTVQLVNEAGEWMTTIHPWQYLNGRDITLRVEAGDPTQYVDLPADFRTLERIRHVDSIWRIFPTTKGRIADMRNIGYGTSGTRWYAFGSRPPEDENGDKEEGAPIRVLDLYPDVSEGDSLLLTYTAGWEPVRGTRVSPLPIESWMEAFYKQVLAAFALGYRNDDLLQRLGMLQASSMFDSLKDRDGQESYEARSIRNTSVDLSLARRRRWADGCYPPSNVNLF